MPTFSLNSSKSIAYTATAAEVALTMVFGRQYRLTTTTDAWFRLTTAGGTAAVVAADDNHFLKGGEVALVSGRDGANRISVIRATADGTATLSEMAVAP